MEYEEIDTWEEPPAHLDQSSDPRQRYLEVVKSLQNNKGKWARLAARPDVSAAKALSANIRKGRLASFSPEGAFESKYDGTIVWVRYVGEPDGSEAPKKYAKVDATTSKAVRTWAKATGRPVSERGGISTQLIAEWQKATRGNRSDDQ